LYGGGHRRFVVLPYAGATPANTIAFGLGGYKFKDFFKIGFPLQILMTVAGCIFIPMFFPF
jgi:di/tricarboxylate transporter